MTEPDPVPPSLLDEHVKTKEKAELFPDEPVGRPAEFREKLDVLEGEHVRTRTKADDRRDKAMKRAKEQVTEEGKVTLRIDGVDDRFPLYSCNICKALILKTGIYEHIITWHDRIRVHGKI